MSSGQQSTVALQQGDISSLEQTLPSRQPAGVLVIDNFSRRVTLLVTFVSRVGLQES